MPLYRPWSIQQPKNIYKILIKWLSLCSKSPKSHLLRTKFRGFTMGYQTLHNLSPSCLPNLPFWFFLSLICLNCDDHLNLLSMFPPQAYSQFKSFPFSISFYCNNLLYITTWFLFSHAILCSNIALSIRTFMTALYKTTHLDITFFFYSA